MGLLVGCTEASLNAWAPGTTEMGEGGGEREREGRQRKEGDGQREEEEKEERN